MLHGSGPEGSSGFVNVVEALTPAGADALAGGVVAAAGAVWRVQVVVPASRESPSSKRLGSEREWASMRVGAGQREGHRRGKRKSTCRALSAG